MKTYALVQDGVVTLVTPEVLDVDGVKVSIQDRMHPDMLAHCVELRGGQISNVSEGYAYDGERFTPPAAVPSDVPIGGGMEVLQDQVSRLSDEVSALVDKVNRLES